jgi:hypothetical protein
MAAIICMYKIEHRIQSCLRNPKIACSTDHVSNIPLRKLNLNLKNRDDIKNLYTNPDPCIHQGLIPPANTAQLGNIFTGDIQYLYCRVAYTWGSGGTHHTGFRPI